MAQVHFVEDYERHVADLMASYPPDEAVELAVGGQYDEVGGREADILVGLGMHGGTSLVDLGCGSGRLAKCLGLRFPNLSYTGIDIIQALLDYAQKQCPAHFRFIKHQEVSIPLESESSDFLVAFSVFTHLLYEETYLYMSEARRVLVLGGKLIFSFCEFADPGHWGIFEHHVAMRKQTTHYPLNIFIEQPVIRLWAAKLGFEVVSIGPRSDFGQSLAVLVRTNEK